jgi:hypothetical protein
MEEPPVEKLMSQAAADQMSSLGAEFDSKEWQDKPALRYRMAPRLERAGLLLGMTKSEIHLLLGEPSFRKTSDKSDREFYEAPIKACGRVPRRYLELGYNLYGQLYWSRITVMGGGVHVFTPAHVYDCSPDSGWKIITMDAPPEDHWQIRIPAAKVHAK